MKVAIITDIHFDCRGGSKYWITQFQKFFSEIFFPRIDKDKITHVLILGDTWEYRYKLGINAMNAAFAMFFDELEKRNIDVKIIYGNHDVAFRNTNDVNSIDFLGKMYNNVTVVKEPSNHLYGKLQIGLVPWINQSNYTQSIDFIKDTTATFLCGHFEVAGCEMTPGHVCEDGLSSKIFERFDAVLSGHFHTVSVTDNIHYISNPFWTTWGDYGQPKGFRILETDTLAMEYVQNPFEIYFKMKYDDSIDVLNFDYDQYENKHIKVFVKSFHEVNQNKFDIFIEKLGKVTETCEAQELEKIRLDADLSETGDFNEITLDNRKMIETYLKSVSKDNSLDYSSVSSLFFDILDEAKILMESD